MAARVLLPPSSILASFQILGQTSRRRVRPRCTPAREREGKAKPVRAGTPALQHRSRTLQNGLVDDDLLLHMVRAAARRWLFARRPASSPPHTLGPGRQQPTLVKQIVVVFAPNFCRCAHSDSLMSPMEDREKQQLMYFCTLCGHKEEAGDRTCAYRHSLVAAAQ